MQNSNFSANARDKAYAEGCRLTRAGKFAEAIEPFSQAIEKNINRAEAYFRRGVCHYLLGNYQMATHDMDAATVLGCQDAQMWSRYALPQSDVASEPQPEQPWEC